MKQFVAIGGVLVNRFAKNKNKNENWARARASRLGPLTILCQNLRICKLNACEAVSIKFTGAQQEPLTV